MSSSGPEEIAAEIVSRVVFELGRASYCVCPGFLSPPLLEGLQQDFMRRYGAKEFVRAGIGKAESRSIDDSIRHDEILWLESATDLAQTRLFTQLDDLKIAFNRQLFLGLTDLEIHYASYPPGGFYQRHLDSFAKENARVVSLVIYLNENWQPAHGGQLRLHLENGTSLDVDPIGGTMVCFLSREIEHEVLPSSAQRKSLAGWFRG